MFKFLIKTAYAACSPNAAGEIPLGDCLELSDGQKVSSVFSTPADIVNLLADNLLVVGGVLFFVFIIGAGFKFLQGGSKGIEESKGVISGVLIGFGLMFGAYWLIQIIKFITGADIVL